MTLFREQLSYFFFKRRLIKRVEALYEMEDPWGAAFLRDFFYEWLRDGLRSMPEKLKSSPVLDAGAGEGFYSEALASDMKHCDLVDISETALSRAGKRLEETSHRLIHSSLDAFKPAPDTYRAIFMISILTYLGGNEHPALVGKILLRLWGSLKREGLLFLIHPYYSQEEKQRLLRFTDCLEKAGARCLSSEERKIGKQFFLLQQLNRP